MTEKLASDSALAAEIKRTSIDNLNKIYIDQTVSYFLLIASFLDSGHKSLHNFAKDGAIYITIQSSLRYVYQNSKMKNQG